jgi:aminoglycoside 6'-N-acetyltransferase
MCRKQGFMEGVIKLRPATLADLELLQQWDEQAHVIASDPNSDWGWEVELDRRPDWREQLIAELDGRPCGPSRIHASRG